METKDNLYNDDIENCVICFENINNNYAKLKCSHKFCISCFVQHARLNNTCPLCRDEFSIKPKKNLEMSDEIRNNLVYHIVHKCSADTDIFKHLKRIYNNPDYYYDKQYEYIDRNGVINRKIKKSSGLEKRKRMGILHNNYIRQIVNMIVNDVKNWYEN